AGLAAGGDAGVDVEERGRLRHVVAVLEDADVPGLLDDEEPVRAVVGRLEVDGVGERGEAGEGDLERLRGGGRAEGQGEHEERSGAHGEWRWVGKGVAEGNAPVRAATRTRPRTKPRARSHGGKRPRRPGPRAPRRPA